MNTDRSCAVFGQHPLRFPWGFDEEAEGCRRMKLELAQSILELRQQGVTEFQVACDPGVGLYAGEIVHALAEQERNIRLVVSCHTRGRLLSGRPSCGSAISICWPAVTRSDVWHLGRSREGSCWPIKKSFGSRT